MKRYFNYWKKPDRTDQKTIIFETVTDFQKQLLENNLKIHDQARFEIDIKLEKTTHFYAFPSKISGNFSYEWYTNLNFARSAQRELLSHLKRVKKKP